MGYKNSFEGIYTIESYMLSKTVTYVNTLKYLFLLSVVFTFHSCAEKDAEPEPEPFLTLSIAENYPEVGRLWGFITDSKGNVIVSQKLYAGRIKFLGTTPDVINLTLLKYFEDPIQSHYTFYTYPKIEAKSIVKLVQSNGGFYNPPNVVSNIEVAVTNFTSPNFETPSIFISDGYSYSIINDPAVSSSVRLELRKPTVDVLLSSHNQDNTNPVYAWVNGVTNFDLPSVNFTDFKPYEKTVTLPAGISTSGYLAGYKTTGTDMQYRMFSSIFLQSGAGSTTPSRLGYLEGYDKYETEVSNTNWLVNPSRTTTYRKLGAINPTITLPDYNLSISNSSIESFAYNYTGNSSFQIHVHGYAVDTKYISWNVYTDGTGVPLFKDFPDDIKDKFPVLDFDKLAFQYSKFYHFTDGYSYPKFFTDMQEGNYPLNHQEYYDVTFVQY